MDIKLYATILLFSRVISMFLMGLVLRRQLQLFRLPIDKEIRKYRIILFILAVAIFAGNVIPAIIDLLTITGVVTRSSKTINGVGLVYSLAWTITSLLSAILISWLYRMSHTVDESHLESDHMLTNKADNGIIESIKSKGGTDERRPGHQRRS